MIVICGAGHDNENFMGILAITATKLSEHQAEPKGQSHLPSSCGHLNLLTPLQEPQYTMR